MSFISSLGDLEKAIDLMKAKSVPYLRIGDVEISRPEVQAFPEIKTTPLKLTPEQQAQYDEAVLFNEPLPNFEQR